MFPLLTGENQYTIRPLPANEGQQVLSSLSVLLWTDAPAPTMQLRTLIYRLIRPAGSSSASSLVH